MADELWRSGNTDARLIPDPTLYSRIAQTIAWCGMLVRAADSQPTLRTHELMPRWLHDGRDDVVCNLGKTRSGRLKNELREISDSFPDLRGGRLMVYFPDADLCDGAAELVSEGFYDSFNTPPWDTWIAYFSDRRPELHGYDAYLLAYVQEKFVDLANAGIIVNPEQCIQWLSDADVTLRYRLLPMLDGKTKTSGSARNEMRRSK